MVNELKSICDLLDGYTDDRKFVVLGASQQDDGTWNLKIRRLSRLEAGTLTVIPAAEVGTKVAGNDNQ